ncbi:hypothetical protein ACLB2K_056026 [Fragaria x ananassa]
MNINSIREVNWHAPNAFEFKVNTDGAARGTPGPAGYGGMFRDHLGNCMSCFAGSMGIATVLEAELQAIIHAISMASRKGWRSLWIECDSAIAIHFLANNKCSVPWRLRADWINCCTTLSSMQKLSGADGADVPPFAIGEQRRGRASTLADSSSFPDLFPSPASPPNSSFPARSPKTSNKVNLAGKLEFGGLAGDGKWSGKLLESAEVEACQRRCRTVASGGTSAL